MLVQGDSTEIKVCMALSYCLYRRFNGAHSNLQIQKREIRKVLGVLAEIPVGLNLYVGIDRLGKPSP